MVARRTLTFAAAACLAVVIGLGVTMCTSLPNSSDPSATEPPSPFVLSVPDNFHFLQDDPKWAGAEMGASGGTLGDFGCTLTAVSMAAANLGIDTNPGKMNAALSDIGGYTARGWLKWSALEEVTEGALRVTVYGAPDDTQIDRCLMDGHYPVVKFKLDDRVQHWALVVGKTEADWVVRDPLDPTRTVRPLMELTSAFESVRCIRPGEGRS